MSLPPPPVLQSTLINCFFAAIQLQFARASLINDPNPNLLRLTHEYTKELLSVAYSLLPEEWEQAQTEVQVAFQDREYTSEQLETMIFNSMSYAVLLGPEDPAAQLMVLIRIPIKSRAVCGFNPTGRRRKKYVFREMDGQAVGFRLYGNWTEYV